MDNTNEIIEEVIEQETHKAIIIKWLKVLYYYLIFKFILSSGVNIGWLSLLNSIVLILALFNLATINEKYRKSAFFYTISLCGSLIVELFKINLVTLTFVVFALCSVMAAYFQYNAHAEITKIYDFKLSQKWRSFFYLDLLSGFWVMIICLIPIILNSFGQIDSNMLDSIETMAGRIVNLVLVCLHGLYLKKTIDLYK